MSKNNQPIPAGPHYTLTQGESTVFGPYEYDEAVSRAERISTNTGKSVVVLGAVAVANHVPAAASITTL